MQAPRESYRCESCSVLGWQVEFADQPLFDPNIRGSSVGFHDLLIHYRQGNFEIGCIMDLHRFCSGRVLMLMLNLLEQIQRDARVVDEQVHEAMLLLYGVDEPLDRVGRRDVALDGDKVPVALGGACLVSTPAARTRDGALTLP